MEYILINESKLKITLGGEELEARALESEKLDYADPDAKQLFCDILEQARQRLGFDTTGYRVLLQLYPIRDGGCELYVTRLSKLDELDGGEDARAEQVRHQKRDAQRKPKKQKKKVGLFLYRLEQWNITARYVLTDAILWFHLALPKSLPKKPIA
jgi:negative regulator of genetic competence, sporulation and motility